MSSSWYLYVYLKQDKEKRVKMYLDEIILVAILIVTNTSYYICWQDTTQHQ